MSIPFENHYLAWVHAAEKRREARQAREHQLRLYATVKPAQGEALTKRDPRADARFVGDGLVAKDPELADLQQQEDRAVQIAIMYGIGALLAKR